MLWEEYLNQLWIRLETQLIKNEYRASHPKAQERYEEWLRTHNLEDYDSVSEDLAEVMEDGTLRPCSEEERQNFRRL